jgi:hypothetical protein
MNKSNSATPTREYSSIEIGALAETFGRSPETIKRWIAANDDMLTSERAKTAIKSVAHLKSNAPAKS